MTRPYDPTESDLRDPMLERLGEGAEVPADRRRALVDAIAGAPTPLPRRRRRRGVWWIAAAAAAAAVVVGVALWPARPDPIPPTALLGDLLGPLPNLAPSEPAPAESEQRGLPTSGALDAVWQDLEGPLAIVVQAVEAPRAVFNEEPSAPAPAGGPDRKEN